MRVEYSLAARKELDEIWEWNARQYGRDHARSYIEFLDEAVHRLAENPLIGHFVPGRPDFRQMTIKWRQGGHGHVVVYRINDDELTVLHIFHTAQDIAGRLHEDE